MSSEITKVGLRKLLTLRLRHQVTGEKLTAVFFEPRRARKYLKEHKIWIVEWNTKTKIWKNAKLIEQRAFPGTDWLSSFLLALEALRVRIPFEQEDEWIDEGDIPSWMILPKLIDYSWGREFHEMLALNVQELTNKHVQTILSRQQNEKQ